MIRALAGGPGEAVGPGGWVDAPGTRDAAGEDLPEHLGGAGSAAAEDAGPESTPTRLYCNLGDVTNLAVARGSACLFTRISPFGIEGIAQKLAERRQLSLEHARQWLVHVGLEAPVEGIDGDPAIVSAARDSLAEGTSRLVDELRLSLEYYSAQDEALPVDGVVACGPGTTIPGLVERLQRDLGQRFVISRPEPLAHLDRPTAGPSDRPLWTRARGVTMRPVNLIPPEERRGERAPLRTGPLAYVIVAVLAVALLAVTVLVVTGNQVSDRKAQVENLQSQVAETQAEAEKLAVVRGLRLDAAGSPGDGFEPRHQSLRLGAGAAGAGDRDSGGRLAYEPDGEYLGR